ncbi:MAG: beta-lactamase family protein [Wenzhouxiangella sp.]|nr:beta-lactamase family protein [Wenzhouxiangella sp.]
MRQLFPFLMASLLIAGPLLAEDADEFVMVPAVIIDADRPAAVEAGSAALAEYVSGLVATMERAEGLPALTLALVQDDALLLSKGFGLADIESGRPVLPDHTLFRIGSVSKTFTWTAVMMLAERGLLDLDVDVNNYLINVQVREAFNAPVTLRDLMHHRAGFEDSMQLFTVADDDPRSLSELLAAHQPKRVFPPGARTIYSNWGSALAAQVVEDVSGLSYGDFLQQEILDPLGMNDTTWTSPRQMDEATRARLATGYKRSQGAFDLQDFMQIGAYWPAGGMASTATDMARWMRLHLNNGELDGVRLLDETTHQAMWTRAFNDRPEAADVAHGFQDRPYRGVRALGHGGGTAAYLTQMVMVPELDLGIFLSYNSAHSTLPFRFMPDLIIDHVVDHRWQPLLAGADEATADALSELAGTYLNNRRVFSSFAAVFGLMGTVTVTAVNDQAIVVSAGGQSTYLQRVTEDVFEGAGGQRWAFVRDDRGRVVALADDWGVHTAERVGWFGHPNTLFIALTLAAFLALTSTLGAWRNYGLGQSGGFASRMAGAGVLVGVAAQALLLAAIIALIISLADFDIGRMPEFYPPAAMLWTHYAGWVVAAVGALMLIAQWPTWSGSGWGLLRRLHFLVFTLATLFLSVMLWHWRIIGAPVV